MYLNKTNVKCKIYKRFQIKKSKIKILIVVFQYIQCLFKCFQLRSIVVEMYQIQDPILDVCVLPYVRLRIGFPLS